jgi:multimeric flavodoxin WrbA
MKICVLSGTPKKSGLCHSVVEAVKLGAAEGGAEVDEIRLCDQTLIRCQVCGEGWGICRAQNRCVFDDDGFNEVMDRVVGSDALVIVTPVYWWETSEALKCFLDRLRRCQFGQSGQLRDKQVLLVASAGGTGKGLLIALEQLDRFCRHTGAVIFDYIGVNRWNCDYKRAAAQAAARALAGGRQNGDNV